MKSFASAVVLLLAVVSDAEAICVPTVRLPGDDPACVYTGTFIDALSYGKQATQRLNDASCGGSDLESVTRTLITLDRVAKDFDCASSLMAAEENYAINDSSELGASVQDLARRSAQLAKHAYLGLAEGTRSHAELTEQILGGQVQMNQVPGKTAKILSRIDDDWRTIFSMTPAVTHVLVDTQPDAAGRLSRLRITAAQRRDLIKRLDTAFGEDARKKAGNQNAVDATAALLRQFLTGGHTDRGAPR